jgi:hypothetical protein
MNRKAQEVRAIIALFFTSWFLTAIPVGAVSSYVGTTGFSFLKIDAAARSAALGGAFVATQGDVNSMGVNPAGLATIGKTTGTASYTDYLLDTQLGFVGFGRALNRKTAWGVGIRYISYGDFQETRSDNPTGEGLPNFGANDWALQFSLSRALSKNLFVGGTLKAIYSKIETYSSDGYAVDLGVLFKAPVGDLSVGASALNIGFVRSGYSSGTQEALPVNFKLGLAYRLAHLPFLLLGDMNLPNDNDPYFSVGGEFTVAKIMFLRAGYKSLYDEPNGLGKQAGLSFGTGFLWRDYQIDYAYSSLAELGKVHRISLAGKF